MDNKIWDIKEKEKICAFDLDGICNYYPDCWIEYANEILNTHFKTIHEMKDTLSFNEYKRLKERYRTSGVKATLKPNPDAIFLTQQLKELGWTIIIITARPAEQYPCLAKQTYDWLNKHGFVYDYVLFGEKSKHVRVLEHFQNLKFAIDDNSYICNQIAKWGYRSFLLNGKQNEDLKIIDGVKRIDSLKEILKEVK